MNHFCLWLCRPGWISKSSIRAFRRLSILKIVHSNSCSSHGSEPPGGSNAPLPGWPSWQTATDKLIPIYPNIDVYPRSASACTNTHFSSSAVKWGFPKIWLAFEPVQLNWIIKGQRSNSTYLEHIVDVELSAVQSPDLNGCMFPCVLSHVVTLLGNTVDAALSFNPCIPVSVAVLV